MNFIKNKWSNWFTDNPSQQKQKTSQSIQKKQQKKQNQSLKNSIDVPQDILQQFFTLSSKYITQSTKKFTDQQKLKLYALYKQSTIGDCNTPKPPLYDLINKSKWNAWNQLKGCLTSIQAKKNYVIYVKELDQDVSKRIQRQFLNEQQQDIENAIDQTHNMIKKQQTKHQHKSGTLKTMVQQIDYSQNYSHPYFKIIQKIDEKQQFPIQIKSKQLLLQKNNLPQCYPLHFAIDKEKPLIVKKFLQFLNKEEIQSMFDCQNIGILQYAELLQNQEIIKMIKQKLQLN